METTIRVNTDLITSDLIEGIKSLFPHMEVEINIQPADATEYIKSKPALARELQERIEMYDKKKEVISLKNKDLL
jgi:hypothetical protein